MGANSCMLCVVVLLLSAGVLGEDAVIVGTANNLIPETAEGLSLVLFHLPTSDASNAFLLEWNRAAQMIKGKAKMIQVCTLTTTMGFINGKSERSFWKSGLNGIFLE